MKALFAAGLLLWSGSAHAQSGSGIATTPGTAPGSPPPLGSSITPLPLGYVLGNDLTPQTRRDRIARAKMVIEADPALVAELSDKQLAGHDRAVARRKYQAAEKKARWARINAREDASQ